MKLVNEKLETLARAIAWDIYPLDVLLKEHGVTYEEYHILSVSPQFKALVAEHAREWTDATSLGKRVKVKAGVIVEEALPTFHKAMLDERIALSQRVDTLKTMMKLAGMDTPEAQGGGGSGVSITFNLGGADTLKVTSKAPPTLDLAVTPEVTEDEFGGLKALFTAAGEAAADAP